MGCRLDGFLFHFFAFLTAFEEVLETIRASPWPTHPYRSGMDGVCHRHRERPDVSALLENLKRDITVLLEVLQETRHSFRLFITAAHGILWDNNQSVVPLTQETSRARYTEKKKEHSNDSKREARFETARRYS